MTKDEKEMVVDWTIPPEDQATQKNSKRLVIEAIKQKGITYPAEITMITGLSRQTVFDVLAKMTYSKEVKRLDIATVREPPVLLKRRLPELWAQGLKGNAIKRMSWYMLQEGHYSEEELRDTVIQNPLVMLDNSVEKEIIENIEKVDKVLKNITSDAKVLKEK